MKLYVAGPMRGHAEFNFPAFAAATERLRADGHDVFSPAERDLADGFDPTGMAGTSGELAAAGFDLRVALGHDLDWICEHADGIYLLRGWQASSGARAEKAVADALGLAVIYEDERGETVLDEAARLVGGDRQAAYGHPAEDFARTAAMWSAILGVPVEPRDVGLCMIALKLSRLAHAPKRDSIVDIAGYARTLELLEGT